MDDATSYDLIARGGVLEAWTDEARAKSAESRARDKAPLATVPPETATPKRSVKEGRYSVSKAIVNKMSDTLYTGNFENEGVHFRVVIEPKFRVRKGVSTNDWDFEFRNLDTAKFAYGTTGESGPKAAAIFRKAAGAMDDFLTKEKPDRFFFQANKEEQSKVDLYTRFAGLLARRHGYDLEVNKNQPGLFVEYNFKKSKAVSESYLDETFDEAFDREFGQDFGVPLTT
jgi:hypothetical protein